MPRKPTRVHVGSAPSPSAVRPEPGYPPPVLPGSPLRVAIVHKTLVHGGAERVVVEQARALSRRPTTVDVLLTVEGASREMESALRAVHPGVRDIVEVSSGWALARALREGTYDLLLTSGVRGAWRVLHWLRAWPGYRRPPVIATLHSPHPEHLETLGRYARRVVDVVATSFDFRDVVVRELGVAANRVVVTPALFPSLLLRRDERAEAEARAMRQGFGVRDGAVVLGYFGRIAQNKGVAHLLRMAARLVTEGRDVHVALGGQVRGRGTLPGTTYEEEIAGAASAPSLKGRVHRIPEGPARAAIYAAFDVTVHASRRDGAPLVLLESLSAGTPAIATNVGGIGTLLRDGIDSVLVPKVPDDGKDLTVATLAAFEHALRALVDDPARRRRLGAAGPKSATDRVDAARFAEHFDAAVDLALAVRRGVAPSLPKASGSS